jgi:hypothetical protein
MRSEHAMRVTFGSFDSGQVAILQTTFDLTCRELGVPSADEVGRSRVAKAVIALAKAGQFDPDRLKVYAISRFRAFMSEQAV